MNSFFKIGLIALIIAAFLAGINEKFLPAEYVEIATGYGSQGREVEEIQRILRDLGFFYGEVTGYYGSQTEAAVLRFQQERELPATGIADSVTLLLLGIVPVP
ncbi:MAG: peptidoglycan-binding protein [Oscillospiraceae bacterium]|jgi:peptidoglycan hydrolase-like protein with peptidoglycan-binding domain|nr:peptidoglycan-binding protein [Oscillospiraceae bacterium]